MLITFRRYRDVLFVKYACEIETRACLPGVVLKIATRTAVEPQDRENGKKVTQRK